MSFSNHPIKQQLEQILKDTKILCELEPFVRKWSLEETLPNFSEKTLPQDKIRHDTISEILQSRLETTPSSPGEPSDDAGAGEKILRRIKEVMGLPHPPPPPKSNNNNEDDNDEYDHGQGGQLIPFHQSHNSLEEEDLLGKEHDRELKRTLAVVAKIEVVDAVSPRDIEEYRRGLGGKPDGPDLNRTTVREWKNIFLEQWLRLNQPSRCQKEAFIKRMMEMDNPHKNKFQSSIYITAGTTLRNAGLSKCTKSSWGIPDSKFMGRKGSSNIATRSNLQTQRRPNSCLPSSSSSPLHSNCFPTLHHHHHEEQLQGSRRAQTALERRKTGILTLRERGESYNQIESPRLGKEKKVASSANKRMTTRMKMGVPPEYKNGVSPVSGSKQGAGAGAGVHYVQQGQGATKKLVNKNNDKEGALGRMNTFRSSTAIKANIEIQRFKEKVPGRPSTSIPASSGMLKFLNDKGKIR